MIIDTLENANKYLGLHPLFAAAFDFIHETDFDQEVVGIKPISDGLKSILSDGPGKTKETALTKFECHNQNIDIQYCIHGEETIAWKPRKDCKNIKVDYNEEKDIMFYNDEPDMFFSLRDGQFVIFYPEDVHAPMIGDGNIRKTVIKVRV
jgi:biofilm protein TabA